jgi:chromosome segregation ATPase
MAHLPSADAIRQVTDVATLHEICLRVIRICEKESESKKQCRISLAGFKHQVEELTSELQSLREKTAALEAQNQESIFSLRISELQTESTSRDSRIAEVSRQNESLTIKLKEHEIEADRKMQLIHRLESEKQSALDAIRVYEDRSKEGVPESRSVVERLQQEKEELLQRTRELEELAVELREPAKQIKSDALTELEASQKIDEIDGYRIKFSELEAVVDRLSTEIQTLRDSKSQELQALRTRMAKNKTKAKERAQRLRASMQQSSLAFAEEKRELQYELDALKTRLSEMEDVERERDFQLKTIIEQSRRLAHFDETLTANATLEREISDLRQKCLEATLAAEEHQQAHSMIQTALDDQNSALLKLKVFVSRTAKLDQMKQRQVDELQKERDVLASKVAALSATFQQDTSSAPPQDAPASSAVNNLETKNRRLAELLQKSNDRYAVLLEEHGRLLDGCRAPAARPVTLSYQFRLVFESDAPKKKSISSAAEKEARLVKAAYLRKVLLQFFSMEIEEEKSTFVPLILELVGCTRDQVSVVMRHWQRSQNLIVKTSGLFGFM